MLAVELNGVSKRFGALEVLRGMSMRAEAGSCTCLFGPSGCGKTTLLRIIAGLERPDKGGLILFGNTVSAPGVFVPPEARGVGMVFQDFALWPHMRVARHLDFVLRPLRLPRAERRARVASLLGLVRLEDKRRAYPRELSGGQQQRLGIARALATRPRILLLDEPFSNLDDTLRTRIRTEIVRLKREEKTTVLIATHDMEDATGLADTVLDMTRGNQTVVSRD